MDDAKLQIVVETIFRKAQVEHSYVNFYAILCSDIIKIELNIKGIEAKASNRKASIFRGKLLSFCEVSFKNFFQDDAFKNSKGEDMSTEEIFKKKHKLFGNIEFVGELYRKTIVGEGILSSVFRALLGLEQMYDKAEVNDDTTEAAIKLMNKLGSDLEQKASKSAKMQ